MRHTPWKKSRKLGNDYGGASRHRTDARNIIRFHDFRRPSTCDNLPIIRVDNPSRNWFHPLNAAQIIYVLKALPKHEQDDVTHVWLRRGGKTLAGHDYCFSDAIWGGGVNLVILYPMRRDLIHDHGRRKPSQFAQRIYQEYGAILRKRGNIWQTSWDLTGFRKFYLYEALLSSVANHSALVWREGRSNSIKAQVQREEDWLFRKKSLADKLFNELFT